MSKKIDNFSSFNSSSDTLLPASFPSSFSFRRLSREDKTSPSLNVIFGARGEKSEMEARDTF